MPIDAELMFTRNYKEAFPYQVHSAMTEARWNARRKQQEVPVTPVVPSPRHGPECPYCGSTGIRVNLRGVEECGGCGHPTVRKTNNVSEEYTGTREVIKSRGLMGEYFVEIREYL